MRRIISNVMPGDEGPAVWERGVVLIVDDDAADRALLQAILTSEGYKVVEASCGGDALNKAIESRPHLIILDVSLPDIGGLDVCRLLRADGRVGNVPVLMLSVRDDDSEVVASLRAGADDYIPKNAASQLVVARVERLIRYRQLASMALLNRQLVQIGRLLTGVIHEIRGPLSVIRGSAELLRMNLPPEQAEVQWVDSILRGSHLLQSRLEHLMATVRSGPPQLRQLEVHPLLREAVDLFVKGLPPNDRGVQFQVSMEGPGALVRADAGRIIQVLIDLLNNAHQAISTASGAGRVELIVENDPEVPDWVKVRVVDDGPGIPELYLGRLFEPFFSTREEGTGYGLYLACEILREQGGRLEASNNAGGGACFTIWLPRTTASGSTDNV